MRDILIAEIAHCVNGGEKMAYPNNIKFANLRAEMARRGINIQGIANAIDVSRDTASNKLAGKSPIYLDEAFRIVKTLFPDVDISYLFSELAACSHETA